MTIVGTRPEVIKVAPVIHALATSGRFEPIVTATAQHRSMLDQALDAFGLGTDHDLDLITPRQTLASFCARAIDRLTPLIEEVAPDAVVVQGDTSTTFAGALAAFYNRVPVVHLEAGLRTGDPYAPYPEEINRRLTTQLATLHLAPTATSKANLLADNVDPAAVTVTGNTVIDALLMMARRDAAPADETLRAVGREGENGRRILLVTAHRRESWDGGLAAVAGALRELAESERDLLVVFPVHKNPVVRDAVLPVLEGLDNVVLLEPLDYPAFVWLLHRSHLVLTDSGGVQEEAPTFGKPVLVLRDTTERPEAVAAGTARLVGTDPAVVTAAVRQLLHHKCAYDAMANAVNPYGDGKAAERTVAALAHLFGLGPRAPEFDPDISDTATERALVSA